MGKGQALGEKKISKRDKDLSIFPSLDASVSLHKELNRCYRNDL